MATDTRFLVVLLIDVYFKRRDEAKKAAIPGEEI